MVETHIVKVEVHIIEIVIVVLVIASVIIIKVQIMRIVHPYINVLVVFLPAQWSSEETFRERKTHTEYHLLYVSPGHVFFFFPSDKKATTSVQRAGILRIARRAIARRAVEGDTALEFHTVSRLIMKI